MRVRHFVVAACAFFCSAIPCAAQETPATSQTITTDMQQAMGGSELVQVIYVTNNSSQRIIVTSIRLMECENVQGNCGVRRTKQRVGPGDRVVIQRVRPRSPDQGFGFSYTFTWEVEAAEGPTAKDLEKDPTALEVDTVVVQPKLLDLKVGETLNLSQVFRIKAMNSAGKELTTIYFYTEVVLGEDFVTLDGSKLTGMAQGTAALLVSATTVQGPLPPGGSKGAARVLVTVKP